MFGVCVSRRQQLPHEYLWSDVCVQGGLGCHPVLASLPVRSLEMPLHAPTTGLPLPFALYPSHFDQSLCFGLPAEQALDRQAADNVTVQKHLFFAS